MQQTDSYYRISHKEILAFMIFITGTATPETTKLWRRKLMEQFSSSYVYMLSSRSHKYQLGVTKNLTSWLVQKSIPKFQNGG